MKNVKFLFLAAFFAFGQLADAQELKTFKLANGLSVYVWEDETQSDVFGMVGVRAGSYDDPEQYTGLAHYLEHMLFKGTQKIGALDWAKEEPIYNQIIAKYDEMAAEQDPQKKNEIGMQINELTIEAAKISSSVEYCNLCELIGDKITNAWTSYDFTCYVNQIPAYRMNQWLTLASERFINPVFREFQTELETVYEEYNRGKDEAGRAVQEKMLESIFGKTPYARSVIGLGEHLKNPQLSKLIEFYQKWYVPGNMVLVIVGNVKANDIIGKIGTTFGKLPAGPVPERKVVADEKIQGRIQKTVYVGYSPVVYMVFNGIKAGSEDEIPLEVVMNLISNSNETGVADKLVLDGEISSVGAEVLSFKEQGRLIIEGVPLYDNSQRRYATNKSTEKKLLAAIEKVRNGEFTDEDVELAKTNLCIQAEIMMEDNQSMASLLAQSFIYGQDPTDIVNRIEKIKAVTAEQIKTLAKKYLDDNYLVLNFEKEKSNEPKDKISKPLYKPLIQAEGQQSMFAQQFKYVRPGAVTDTKLKLENVQTKKINELSELNYTKNPNSNIFNLTIRYGVGTNVLPKLAYAATLMNDAGIMGNYKSQELKKQFAKLHVDYAVAADEDYLTIQVMGEENSLTAACDLLSRLILMPELDEKQLNRLKNNILGTRYVRRWDPSSGKQPLLAYVLYRDNSPYIKEPTDYVVNDMTIADLTGDITRAANYAAKIYYTGSMPFDDVHKILSEHLPLVAHEKPSDSPQDRKIADVSENTVYFYANNDAKQAQIYFYFPMLKYSKEMEVITNAFYQYFSGDFNGLVLTEIREKRSMAYSAGARPMSPTLAGNPIFFYGTIGTQNDKTIEAVTVFMDLLKDMPRHDWRIDNIKSYLLQICQTSNPGARSLPFAKDAYKLLGFEGEPMDEMIKQIESLTMDDIMKFYEENIKGKPVVIGIMGNPKDFNVNDLAKFGKVNRIGPKQIYNTTDSYFY